MNAGETEAAPLRRVRVAASVPYEVLVGGGALAELPRLITESSVALIADANVAGLYAPALLAGLEAAGKRAHLFTFPPGEASKSLMEYGRLLEELAAAPLPRGGAVVGLGGGVAGDLAGFVAATYMRGVSLYQAPTSLLAMVDASVGGKTGLDLKAGKNLVGAFWQPRAVVADVESLRSLPAREFRRGTVELVKHGLLADAGLVSAWRAGWSQEAPAEALTGMVARSVAVKAGVVARDEFERGERAHLNLGHTLAHALEAASAHRLPHGDAVAYGLVYAALLGRRRGFVDFSEVALELFNWVAPAPIPLAEFAELHAFMRRDKKAAAGGVRFVLLREIGDPLLVGDLTYGELERAHAELLKIVA